MTLTALVLLFTLPLLPLGACREATAPALDPDTAAAGGTPAGRLAPTPGLAELRLADMTPKDLRPEGVAEQAAVLVRDAFFDDGAFLRAAESEAGACRAQVVIGYGLLQNGRPALDPEAGETRAVIEAEVHCPRGVAPAHGEADMDTLRLSLVETRSFGGVGEAPWRARIAEAIATVARRAAQALHGQVRMRRATDAEVLDALAHDRHAGILAEAASEAGERRLTAAVADLVRLTAHEEALVGLRAGAALGLLHAEADEVVRALVKMTDGPSGERHLVAIHALGDIASPEALRYLDNLAVSHPDAALREAAREAAKVAREVRPTDRDAGP